MRKPLITCLLSLAAGSLLVLPGAAHASVLSCGDQLTQDTTLTADLHCGEGAPTVPRPDGTDSYASILIADDDVTLDLNGHEISSYFGDAIVAYGRRNITVRNGTAWGISLNEITDSHIHHIRTAGGGTGIGLTGSHRNRVEHNTGRSEGGIGLYNSTDNLVADNDIGAPAGALSMSNAHRNRIVHNSLCGGMGGPLYTSNADDNLFKANLVPSQLPGIPSPHCYGLGGDGFDIGPDSTGNRLIENSVFGIRSAPPELGLDDINGDGIDVQSPGNYLAQNTANDNARYGISAVPGNQSGINYASGNGNPAQCLNVICRPGPERPAAPAGPRPAPTPGQPATPADHLAPRARLVRQASQRLGRSLRLTVTAGNEDLWLSATAKIRISDAARAHTLALPRERYIAKGDTRTVKLRLGAKLQARLARALDQGQTVTAKLTISLRDRAGNSRTKRHTLKLTPRRL